ncbi:site-specific DNA-methyltransferase (adenine-specific) [Pullulanibacillus pueri]|uniref:Class I SAM-dependent methyltransferase n=1 Tax=Pullulanibacillus pueri TaxID=1437324 RepID=A0A8J2ZZJ3_9BACL|nr:class I SAM-dependent methyltransferase [Pullulanibacillus pueri]MBM7683499.1 site-specific DNA-methyltransferase (adenine-specific) [Pullulanibacillus pueri]GGH86684.1 hypothetical protein GCM10007096_34960 [Pullulanibacillus pueri]
MEQGQLLNHLFERLDQSATLLEKEEEISYLEALCLTVDNICNGEIKQEILKDQLTPIYDAFFIEGMTAEDVRKAFQLALLKGMKQASQPQHQMTPDGIALFISYLMDKLELPEAYSLLDPAIGTANLMTTVMNHVQNKPKLAMGVEIDDLLINLAHANINLQQQEIELFHQDALRPLMMSPIDVIITDLPVGTYYNKEIAKGFRVGKGEEPFSHFLLIEQALNYLKPAGYFIGLIPNQLFTADVEGSLHQLIRDEADILAFIELPESTFKDSRHAKSILVLQKKGEDRVQPEDALLVKLPSFKDRQAMAKMIARIDAWFREKNNKV